MAYSLPTPDPPSCSFSPPIAVLQCSRCLVILSDTLRYFVSSHAASQTIAVSAAHNISVAPDRLRAKSGHDVDCCFRLTSCANCSAPLGRFYTDASPGRESLLNNYSFASAALVSYQLGSIDGAFVPAPASAPSSSTVAANLPAPELSGGPACDMRGGGSAGSGGKDLALALANLDAHVAKLTSAANVSTQAQGRMGEDFRVVREEAARVASKLSENETTLDKMQNLLIRWEDRFAVLERRAGLVEDRLAERDKSPRRFAKRQDGALAGRNEDEDDDEDGNVLNEGLESPRGGAERGGVDFRSASDGREDGRIGRRGGRNGRKDGNDVQKSRK